MLLDETNIAAVTQDEYAEELPLSEQAPAKAQPELRTFGLPSWIWTAMLACYATFFGGLLIATGSDGGALMMIIISVLYTGMYFGTAGILSGLGNAINGNRNSQWKDGRLQTISGDLELSAVASQVLVVPAMFALFGMAIAIMVAIVT